MLGLKKNVSQSLFLVGCVTLDLFFNVGNVPVLNNACKTVFLLDFVTVNSSLSAVCRAHLRCSRCWTGSRGSSSVCSGTGPRPDSRPRPQSPSCGSPRGPWRRSCLCSRPGHIARGGGWLLIPNSMHLTGHQTYSTVSSAEKRCSALLSNLVLGPLAPPCGETMHYKVIIYGPDCRHSRIPPPGPVCCLRPPPGQILASGHPARGYLCAALRSILIQGIRIFLKRGKQDLFYLSIFFSLFFFFKKIKWPGPGIAYLFWMFSGWHLPPV